MRDCYFPTRGLGENNASLHFFHPRGHEPKGTFTGKGAVWLHFAPAAWVAECRWCHIPPLSPSFAMYAFGIVLAGALRIVGSDAFVSSSSFAGGMPHQHAGMRHRQVCRRRGDMHAKYCSG